VLSAVVDCGLWTVDSVSYYCSALLYRESGPSRIWLFNTIVSHVSFKYSHVVDQIRRDCGRNIKHSEIFDF
jgi:hypothetical protein